MSAGGAEALVALLEESRARTVRSAPRQRDRLAVQALEGVLERGAVVLGQHRWPDLDHVVRTDPEDVRVEGPVVDRAHRDAVRQHRLPALRVLLDVRGVEELAVTE